MTVDDIEVVYYFAVCLQVDHEKDGFKWDSKTQNEVLGAFFLLHWVTQVRSWVLS